MLNTPENELPETAVFSPPAETEGQRLLAEWNRTAADYPRNACIHQIFEAQAAATPDAIALAFQNVRMTYAQLNRRSNQLAHALRRGGVGPEVMVGVAMERSPERIVALLGILKAGGAYLPLDCDAPQSRLQFMLQDANIKILLTQNSRCANLPETDAKILCLDGDWEGIAHESEAKPACETTAENLAYVLFTSGSTGTPKGVMVAHRAVVRLVCNTDYVRLDANEVLLQMAPLAFDASTFEIWGALLNGATLAVLPPQEAALCDIGRAIAQHQVTTLWLTAGLFHQMVDRHLEALRPLRQLLAGGDVLGVPQVRRVIEALPNCQVINGYGPTETTTFACCCPVQAAMRDYPTIPIGRPIANTRAYVLDDDLQPLPVGVPGELYIGGDGVARGYLNRPELTAEKFFQDPFHDTLDSRCYRTGDRVRYLPDGNIEFLGRMDDQLKIRGYRVEPGEIEAALRKHPAVDSAVVVTRGETSDSKQLVAYLTGDELPTTAVLRAFLREHLPEYSVPALFQRLPELPLTPNGKVDRNALAYCNGKRLASGVVYVAPHGVREQTIAGIWQAVLEVEKVGLHENFFDMGGDSLRLTQVHSQVQERLNITLELTVLFQYPTVSALAKHLQNECAQDGPDAPSPQGPTLAAITDRAARQREALNRRRQFVKGSRNDG